MTRGLEAYLPSWLALRPIPTPPAARKITGAFLFSDISGFTALTEKLQAQGRAGAEEIAELVSAAFGPAIRAIRSEGGAVLSFGGDALLSGFRDPGGVARAERAAGAIARAFARHGTVASSAGPVTLGVRQAIHHGTASELHLGTRDRRHYLVAGRPLVTLARLETAFTHPLIRSAAAARVRTRPSARSRARAGRRPATSAKAPRLLETYLPPRLPELAKAFRGGYRHAAILFLETRGFDRRSLGRTFRALSAILPGYGGMLLKTDLSTSGTKWLCVFGIPVAHEDLGERAARAALDILDVGKGGLRGGLHEGVVANVIVGTPARRSFDVMGDAVNTAARALSAAAWGEVVVTRGVRDRLTGVETEPRGAHAVKGKKATLELHALTRVTGARVQLRVSAPMVGRDAELGTIVAALERAKAGEGSVIAVEGNPGLGKSRLKYEASLKAKAMGIGVHEGRAISFGGTSSWVVGDLLRQILGAPVGTSKQEVLAAVTAAAERLAMKDVDRHHLAEVLGARYEATPLVHLKPQDIRLNNMIAIRTFCHTLARADGPRLMVLEDLHWADEASREAIAWVAKDLGGVPLVVLLLHRPGYEPPAGAAHIGLGELGPESVGMLLRALLGAVPAKVEELVAEKAAGNPFYVEELVRHLLETGLLALGDEGYVLLREPGEDDLPDRLETLIAARLDRLTAEVKRVAELGAVIGRSFLYDILGHLETEDAVRAGVADLRGRELIFEKAKVPRLEYIWKHALTRDVAYAGILASRRRRLHGSVANAIEVALAGEIDHFQAMLGHHRALAGDRARARRHYLAAARRAAAVHAEEAELLYQRYLGLVDTPDAESLEARIELGSQVLHLRGRVREAEAAYRTAREEAHAMGDRRALGMSVAALGSLTHDTGRTQEARELYEEALALHRDVGNRQAEGVVLGNLGTLLKEQGQPSRALALQETALAIHREVGNRRLEGIVLGGMASTRHEQGRLDEARTLYQEALACHQEIGDRRLQGNWLGNLANLEVDAGRRPEARALFEQALQIDREVGTQLTEGIWLAGLADVCRLEGQAREAEELFQEAIRIQRQVGNRRFEAISLANLSTLTLEQGRMEDARTLADQAITLARELGDRRIEGSVLGRMAIQSLLATGVTEAARALAAEGMRILEGVGDTNELGKSHCIRGHIALASGRDPLAELGRAKQCAREVGVGPESELAEDIAKLQRARRASLAGTPLIRGYAPEDLPEGLLEHVPGALPSPPPETSTPRSDESP